MADETRRRGKADRRKNEAKSEMSERERIGEPKRPRPRGVELVANDGGQQHSGIKQSLPRVGI